MLMNPFLKSNGNVSEDAGNDYIVVLLSLTGEQVNVNMTSGAQTKAHHLPNILSAFFLTFKF